MPTSDILEALAAMTCPMPDAESLASGNPHLSPRDFASILSDLRMEVMQEREQLIAEWREQISHAAEDDQDVDPLLDALAAYRSQMLNLEHRMRLLIAYAREFVRPQPYQLKALAHAAGMSISGVRIAYDEDEIREVEELTGAKPRRPQQSDAS